MLYRAIFHSPCIQGVLLVIVEWAERFDMNTYKCVPLYDDISLILDVPSGILFQGDQNVRTALDLLYRGEQPDSTSSADLKEAYGVLLDLKDQHGLTNHPHVSKDLFDFRISYVSLNVALACNFHCEYCYADGSAYGGKASLMSHETAHRVVDLMLEAWTDAKSRPLSINFFGGEPLLNFPVIASTIEYARCTEDTWPHKWFFSISTNGSLIDREIAQFLFDHNVNITLSLDGPPQLNDRIRSSQRSISAFAESYRGLEQLVAAGYELDQIGIRSTVTPKNNNIAAIMGYFTHLGVKFCQAEPASSLPLDHPLHISTADLSLMLNGWDECSEMVLDALTETSATTVLRPLGSWVRGIKHRKRRPAYCMAGFSMASITPDGSVFPCHRFSNSEMVLGNIYDMTRMVSPEDDSLFYARVSDELPLPCKECWIRYYCSGGCAQNAYLCNGTLLAKIRDAECAYWKGLAHQALHLISRTDATLTPNA